MTFSYTRYEIFIAMQPFKVEMIQNNYTYTSTTLQNIKQHELCYSHSHSGNETKSSSADEKANVNFFNDDIVHVLQNTIESHKFKHRLMLFVVTGSQASKQRKQQ